MPAAVDATAAAFIDYCVDQICTNNPFDETFSNEMITFLHNALVSRSNLPHANIISTIKPLLCVPVKVHDINHGIATQLCVQCVNTIDTFLPTVHSYDVPAEMVTHRNDDENASATDDEKKNDAVNISYALNLRLAMAICTA